VLTCTQPMSLLPRADIVLRHWIRSHIRCCLTNATDRPVICRLSYLGPILLSMCSYPFI